MSKYLILLSTLGIALADYNPWAPVDATVTKIVSRTAYVCPCDGSTSYGPDWNVWQTDVSDATSTWSGYTWTTTSPKTTSTSTSIYTPPVHDPRCYTDLTDSQVPYSTEWSTSYTSCTSTVTVSLNTTTVLPAMKNTITTTSTTTTTAPTAYQTSTVTNTLTITTNTTVTATAYTTETTTSVSTSTVPASAGFVPVQSTLPNSTYSGSGGNVTVAKRDISPVTNGTDFIGLGGFPKAVTCVTMAPGQCSAVTTTVYATQTITPNNVTSTITSTSTSTIVPSATTTTTTTSTSTTTNTMTTTSTSTTTTTSIVAGPTVYAQCAANNLADTVNGLPIGNIGSLTGSYTRGNTNATSAYDCCVAGLLNAKSSVTVYVPYYATAGYPQYTCFYFTASTCNNQTSNTFQGYQGLTGLGQLTLSNQVCGEYTQVYTAGG